MTFDPNNHEHDDDENCLDDEGNVFNWAAGQAEDPNWEFSPWDLAGVFAHTMGGVMSMVSQGFTLLAREFYAAGQFSRGQRVEKLKRRSIVEDIRALERGEVDDG